ncbi:threonine ammonia-lyase [Cucumibacter marinus]|uniref:threonine ammonia-lyase n=1 Tax=Cucumibacter marinus TaxID=1121252 RepID=UPI0004288E78|nr:pyridoxal-phosphate dependent enzyme [Cucumibacter marinus]
MATNLNSRLIEDAAVFLRDRIVRTPTVASPGLSAWAGRQVVVKLETLQLGSSFKPRGVLFRMAQLSDEEKRKGVVAVSGGNFGLAVALGARDAGIAATIVMPEQVAQAVRDAVTDTGARLEITADVTSSFARGQVLAGEGLTLMDDCGDPHVAAGHGTLGLEMVEDHPEITDVLIAVGGGAMLAGAATAIKSRNPDIRIWGVETEEAASMTAALSAGKPETVAVSGAIPTLAVPEVDAMALDATQRLVEDILLVSETSAFAGMADLAGKGRIYAEPAAGALAPGLKALAERVPEDAVIGLVICGGNIGPGDFGRILTSTA